MKKIFSVFLVISILMLSLCGCDIKISRTKKDALVISGTEINEEIYNYYLDVVTQRPGDYNISSSKDEDAIKDAAIEQCKRYLAINTSFKERNLKLTNAQKIEIADNVNNFWIRSEAHYEKIGVSRQTLSKILTANEYEDAIFSSIYDKGMDDTEAEGEIQAYFYANYTAFLNICAYYTTGSTTLTEQEKQNLIASFENIAQNSGESAEDFTNACSDAGYSASSTVIIEKESEGYPSGFFLKVYTMEPNTVRVFSYDDCVFCIRKESLASLGDEVYSNYRDTCIEKMYSADWQQTVDNYLKNFTIDEVNI